MTGEPLEVHPPTAWPGTGSRRTPGLVIGIAASMLVVGAGAPAAAADPASPVVSDAPATGHGAGRLPESGGRWFSIGVLAGSAQPDADLADYQWNTTPRVAWGAQALAGSGRWAIGPRLWRTQTTQGIDLSGVATATTVRSTSLELVGQGQVATLWGARVLATASVGRLHLGYHPDQVTVGSGGSGNPIVVEFAPVNEWIAGGGLSVQRPLTERWTVSVQVDNGVFALDTAHRNGSVIEYGRESFAGWNVRLGLARIFQWR